MGMSLMAVSSVNVALATIEDGLGASASDLQWVLSGYALAFGIALIPAGAGGGRPRPRIPVRRRHGDLRGGLLFCGLATAPWALNVARLAQGLGAGLYPPQVTGMIQQYFTGGGRARAFALLGLVVSASVAVGPVFAGTIIQFVGSHDGWRWTFFTYILVGLAGIAFALAWFPFETERRLRGADRPRVDLDPVGTLLMGAAVLGSMYPFMARTPWAGPPARRRPHLVGLGALGAPLRRPRWRAPRRPRPAGYRSLPQRHYRLGRRLPRRDEHVRRGRVVPPDRARDRGAHRRAHRAAQRPGLGVRVGLHGPLRHGQRPPPHHRRPRHRPHLHPVGHRRRPGSSRPPAFSFWWLAAPLGLMGLGMGTFMSANQTMSMQDVPGTHGGTPAASSRPSNASPPPWATP